MVKSNAVGVSSGLVKGGTSVNQSARAIITQVKNALKELNREIEISDEALRKYRQDINAALQSQAKFSEKVGLQPLRPIKDFSSPAPLRQTRGMLDKIASVEELNKGNKISIRTPQKYVSSIESGWNTRNANIRSNVIAGSQSLFGKMDEARSEFNARSLEEKQIAIKKKEEELNKKVEESYKRQIAKAEEKLAATKKNVLEKEQEYRLQKAMVHKGSELVTRSNMYGYTLNKNNQVVKLSNLNLERELAIQKEITGEAKERMNYFSNQSALALSRNMSTLTVTFGMMNAMAAIQDWSVNSEMAEIQAKEKLTNKDKAHLKVLRKRRFEMNKLMHTLQLGITAYQGVMMGYTLYYQWRMNKERMIYIAESKKLTLLRSQKDEIMAQSREFAMMSKLEVASARNMQLQNRGKPGIPFGTLSEKEKIIDKNYETAASLGEIDKIERARISTIKSGVNLKREDLLLSMKKEQSLQQLRNEKIALNNVEMIENSTTEASTVAKGGEIAVTGASIAAKQAEAESRWANVTAKLAELASNPMTWVTLAVSLGLIAWSTMQTKSLEAKAMAQGGIVKARPGGTIIRAGEAGSDEAIIPLNKMSGLGETNITINALDPTETYQIINNMLDRRNNSRW